MRVIEAIAELAVRAIGELGQPMTIIVTGADGWATASRFDADRQTIILEQHDDADDHLPITIVLLGPNDRAQVHRLSPMPAPVQPQTLHCYRSCEMQGEKV